MGVLVTVVNADDYSAIYFNDDLEWVGETYTPFTDILKVCEHNSIELAPTIECSLEWFDEQDGIFPKSLQDVKVLHMGKEISIAEYWELS